MSQCVGVSVRMHIISSAVPNVTLTLHHSRLIRCIFVLCYSHFSSRFDPSLTDFESKMMALPKSEGSTDAKRPLANIHPSSSSVVFHISQRICTHHKKLISAAKLFLFGQVQIETVTTLKIHLYFIPTRKWSC